MKLDKEKIKRYSKIAQYCVIALCWLMALIGISAYTIYWCRANVDYETSQNNKLSKPRYNAVVNRESYYYWTLKSETFLREELSYRGSENDYDDYFSVDQGTSGYLTITYQGDFGLLYDTDTYINYSFMTIFFEQVDSDYFRLDRLNLARVLPNNQREIYYVFNYGSNIYHSLNLITRDIYTDNPSHVTEYVVLGVFQYYFTQNFSTASDYSTSFEFKTDYNFNSLISENITGDSNVIQPYKLTFNGDPLDEVIYAYVKMDFVSNNYIYKGIYLELRKPYLVRYNGQDLQVNFYGSTSQLIVSRVFYLRELPPSLVVYSDPSIMDLVAVRHSYGDKLADIGQGDDVRVTVYGTDYTFINDAYRLVYIENNDYNAPYDIVTMPQLNSIDNDLYNPYLYRGLALYQVLNNGYLTYDLGTLTYDMGDSHFGDVFTLYTQAFTGLMPILNIQILPSFTLGMLLFIPLVITIIIVILRLVKK